MLGCDYHCSYCFSGSTRVATNRGMLRLDDLFANARQHVEQADGQIGFPDDELRVYSHTGQSRPVRALFRHFYEGDLLSIEPAFLPPIECTPDHEFLVTPRPMRGSPPEKPRFMPAHELNSRWCLAVPKHFTFSRQVVLNTAELLEPLIQPFQIGRQLAGRSVQEVIALTERGWTGAAIAQHLGEEEERVAQMQQALQEGTLLERPGQVLVEEGRIRFSKEHAPGIPAELPLDRSLAMLLGYYSAEGCLWRDRKRRVQSAMLTFSFGRHEAAYAERVQGLLADVFGVEARIHHRQTTHAVVTYKASLGLLFETLCGAGAHHKRVPSMLFEATEDIVEAFLNAYVEGDGSRSTDGIIQTSKVSEELAWGIAWLALKLGMLPSFHRHNWSQEDKIGERSIFRRSPHVFSVRWRAANRGRRCWEDENYYYVPIRSVTSRPYNGFVYNLEVEEDHTYLANFAAVHNCQNYVTSQALRDPVAGVPPRPITPEAFVALAEKHGARVVTSTYNEPLITSEWAVEIFKAAKRRGLITSYVSNGNGTPEVLDYIRPWVDLYKVDLKSFDDKHYRSLGGVLDRVLDTVKMLVEKGFWLEVVTLIVPGFNDSTEELRSIAEFLASVSPDIPWHVTAFHKDYKMQDPDNTPVSTLVRAAKIGYEMGLNFVYAGNIPGHVGNYENTHCPKCKTLLIERYGFRVLRNNIRGGSCPKCHTPIPGRWDPVATTTTITDRPLRVIYR
jgi:pyruvate formate lyase activating enzyme